MRIASSIAGAALLTLLAEPAVAQRVGIHAEGGVVRLHGVGGAGAGFHVFRLVGRTEATRLDFGAIGDVYSVAIDTGLDYRVPVAARLALVLRGGAGFMVEGPEWVGAFLRLGGGFAWRYSTNAAVTVIFDGATHDGLSGPNRLMLGWEQRFGKKKSSPRSTNK